MVIKRGQIYYAEFHEAKGSEQGGTRPCIIVSNNVGNAYSKICEVVCLTSRQTKTKLPTHVTINSCKTKSIALCEQITTLSQERLLERVGQLTEEEMRAVDKAMLISLGIGVAV